MEELMLLAQSELQEMKEYLDACRTPSVSDDVAISDFKRFLRNRVNRKQIFTELHSNAATYQSRS